MDKDSALTIHYIEQITFFLYSRHLVPLPPIRPSVLFRSPRFVPFVHMDIYNESKHLINLKLEFLTVDASRLKPKTGWVELIRVCVCACTVLSAFSHCHCCCLCCFRCHCLIIYVLSSSLCPFVLRGGRFIKFQCVLLFITNTRRSINTQAILNRSLSLYSAFSTFLLYLVVVVVVVCLFTKNPVEQIKRKRLCRNTKESE